MASLQYPGAETYGQRPEFIDAGCLPFIGLLGWVLGPIGMILSVPMTSLVAIALESYEETRGLGFMLGSDTEIEWIEGLETAMR